MAQPPVALLGVGHPVVTEHLLRGVPLLRIEHEQLVNEVPRIAANVVPKRAGVVEFAALAPSEARLCAFLMKQEQKNEASQKRLV